MVRWMRKSGSGDCCVKFEAKVGLLMSLLNLASRLLTLWQNKAIRTELLRGVGIVAGVGVGVVGYAYLREPLNVRLDRLTVRLPNCSGKLPPTGLRILHISDTHFRGANWREHAKIDCVRRACAGLEYDLLIHTGDFLQEDSGLSNVSILFDALPAPRLGAYAVFGNHDYSIYSHSEMVPRAWAKFQEEQQARYAMNGAGLKHGTDNWTYGNHNNNGNSNGHAGSHVELGHVELDPAEIDPAEIDKDNTTYTKVATRRVPPLTRARMLLQFGHYFANVPFDLKRTGRNDVNALEATLAARQVQTLHNRSVRLTDPDRGLDIYLAGVDDVVEGTPELGRTLVEIPYDAPTILLSHNPDILGEPGIEQVDLVLSGHTHGGQVVLPLIGAAHTQTLHLHRKEVSGYLCRGKTQVYITRGVGEGIPLRFGAAPQITLITVLPE